MLQELRQSLRALARRPSFTVLAIVTLALGIGANTAIFSAFYRILYEPLPYPALDRLVYLYDTQPAQGVSLAPRLPVTAAWREHAQTLVGVAVSGGDEKTLTGAGEPEVLKGSRISASLPEVLGVTPLVGRTFTEAEEREGAAVVLLGEGIWKRRFGGDPDLIGRTIQLGGVPQTVIGVMPDGFRLYDYAPSAQYWVPFAARHPAERPVTVARLAAGVTTEQARADLIRVAEGVAEITPMPGEWTYRVLPVLEMGDGRTRAALPVLLGAVGLVLLIACANVAGLLMVRLTGRQREISVRAALGASRPRILATLFLEQLVLAVAGGALGILFAAHATSLMRRFRPSDLHVLDTIRLQPEVLAFACALVALTTLLFGLLPAALVLRRSPGAVRADEVRVTGGTRARAALVTAQIALSLTLMVGAVLLIRSFQNLRGTDLGFEPGNRLVVELAVPPERYRDSATIRTFYSSIIEGAAAIPGVRRVALGGGAPPDIGLIFGELQVEGGAAAGDEPFIAGTGVAPGYLQAIGARIIAGRDVALGEDGVVINQTFAQRFWPGESAVGRRVSLSGGNNWTEVVGVIADVRVGGAVTRRNDIQLFVPLSWDWPQLSLIMETDSDPFGVLPALRQVVRRVDADVPIRLAESLAARMAQAISRERFIMGMLTAFAALALTLTAVGLYGLIAYSVQQRTREIGIRVALGAQPGAVRRLFLSDGARLALIGIGFGLAGAAAGARLLAGMLHGTSPFALDVFIAATLLIAATTLFASWLPARRAARLDPLEALR